MCWTWHFDLVITISVWWNLQLCVSRCCEFAIFVILRACLFSFLNKTSGLDKTSPRRRAYSTNQISDYNPAKKVYTPSDPSSVAVKNPLRRAKVQELIGQMSPEYDAQWRSDYQVSFNSNSFLFSLHFNWFNGWNMSTKINHYQLYRQETLMMMELSCCHCIEIDIYIQTLLTIKQPSKPCLDWSIIKDALMRSLQ